MATNDTLPARTLNFYTITIIRLYLELQKEKAFTRQLEQRLLSAEEEIKGLCAIAEFGESMDEVICNLMSQVERLSAQVAALSQAGSTAKV